MSSAQTQNETLLTDAVVICRLRRHSSDSDVATPVTVGVPIARGVAVDARALSLRLVSGETVPLQAKELERWPDGSLRWLLLDFILPPLAGEVLLVSSPTLAAGRTSSGMPARTRVLLSRVELQASEVALADGQLLHIEAQDEQGRLFHACWSDVQKEDGPVRVMTRARGQLSGAEVLAELDLRLHTYAEMPLIRVDLTVRNPRAAGHPGGCWDLGSDGSVYFRRLTIAFGKGLDATSVSAERGAPLENLEGDWSLLQASSGKRNWKSSNHVNRKHEVPLPWRGYRLNASSGLREGRHATPMVVARSGQVTLGLAVEEFWQNFPQAIERHDGQLLYHLFPPQMPDVQELCGGEQKTWTFWLAVGDGSLDPEILDGCRQPAAVLADPEYYSSTEAFAYLTPKSGGDGAYAALVDAAMEGGDTFERKREVLDEFGWRHFGDIYGDHEAVLAKGPAPLVSHYNNQYDCVMGLAIQGVRSGDVRWLRQMRELARHVIDIDIYHTTRDKSAYNGGMFWHTVHYIDADTAGHRTYPGKAGLGGGPNPGHLYTTGLLHYYYLTGDPAARDAVIGLGQYVIDCDDGSKTVFRWLSRAFTGLATDSDCGYHGPGRASGNSLNALLDAHRLSGDSRFLDKAQQLICRCVHPSECVEKHDLLDGERRWFYTMFLQALGKYLDYKVELGQLDEMYAYARESLLHYARWMAQHEYPYLDTPEKLEYPTETWAAQDMRKSEVFAFAARHADADEQARFRERCDFFFEYSVQKLSSMPTRSLARPVALLLTNGLMREYLWRHGLRAAPRPQVQPAEWPTPAAFVAQKRIAMRRAKSILAAGALALIVGLSALAWRLLQ